jgi:hypothetical protein
MEWPGERGSRFDAGNGEADASPSAVDGLGPAQEPVLESDERLGVI